VQNPEVVTTFGSLDYDLHKYFNNKHLNLVRAGQFPPANDKLVGAINDNNTK